MYMCTQITIKGILMDLHCSLVQDCHTCTYVYIHVHICEFEMLMDFNLAYMYMYMYIVSMQCSLQAHLAQYSETSKLQTSRDHAKLSTIGRCPL